MIRTPRKRCCGSPTTMSVLPKEPNSEPRVRAGRHRPISPDSARLNSTAALLAGFAIASAQEMPGGKSGGQSSGAAQGGAQMERGSAGATQEKGRAGQAQRGAQEQSKQGQSQQRS